MPSRELRWSDLIPGTIAVLAVVLATYAVMRYARVGQLHGRKATVYAITGAARGIMAGTTEVWLEGQKIGLVKNVDFRGAGVDTSRRIVLELEVVDRALPLLRRDSGAQIRAGGSLIGAQVVYLKAGTVTSPPLHDGDSLVMAEQSDTEGLSSQMALTSREFPAIIGNVKALAAEMDRARGTAGAVLNDERGPRELQRFSGQASGLMQRATSGRGTVALALHGGLGARARGAMASADSIRALLASGETSFGRFRRDSTLLHQVADVRAELSIVSALMAEPRGTAGRVLADSAAQMQVGRISREMGDLFADIKAHPMRYIAF